MILLLLILYIYAIIGVMFFGENDPFFYGYLLQAMLTLFQVSAQPNSSSLLHIRICVAVFSCLGKGLSFTPRTHAPT